jgi:hypothetical protein
MGAIHVGNDIPTILELRTVTPRPDCRIWTGATERGYGRISIDGANLRAHRVAWEQVHGPIPDGSTIDHLCKVKPCVNVEHMELVTVGENSARANHEMATKRRTYNFAHKRDGLCAEGHDLAGRNGYSTLNDPDYIRCRTCEQARRRARYLATSL